MQRCRTPVFVQRPFVPAMFPIAIYAVLRYERQALQMKLKRPDEVVLVSLDP